jgi:hypothetical protein
MATLLPSNNGHDGPPRVPSAPTKDELYRRTELLAQAEAQAALAVDHARLAERATGEDLLALPVVAAAMEQAFSAESSACERWAAQAEAVEDVLLARALRRLAADLAQAAGHAASLRGEAEGYAETLKDA